MRLLFIGARVANYKLKIDEFLWLGVATVVFVALYYTIVISYGIFSTERVLLMTGIHSTLCFSGGCIMAGWVCYKLEKQNKLTSKIGKRLSPKNNDTTSSILPAWIAKPLRFEEIVGTEDGFELFSNHLVSEYSIENMLYVLELEIIKDEMIEYRFVIKIDPVCFVVCFCFV